MENFPKHKEGTAERSAEDALRGLRVDYANRDKLAEQELEEQPSVKEQLKNLHTTAGELTELRNELQKKIMDGVLDSSDPDTKVEVAKMLSEAESMTQRELVDSPNQVEMQQKSWENASENLQKEHTAPTERMLKAVGGEITAEEAREQTKDSRGIKDIERVLETRQDMDSGELKKFKDDLNSSLERLRELEPKVEAMVEEKSLSPCEKEGKLKQYKNAYDEYQKLRGEVGQLIKRARK